MPVQRSERSIVFLVGAVQFVNILDFMMVMPLGPDFAADLGIPTSHLGYIGGSYTAAAAVTGLVCSFFLERFDRRKALAVAMLGLCLVTALGAAAVDLWTLLGARVLAGCFGGPATSIALAIIADVIPPERRGRAMGAVMGAFALASVLGVPAGLELSRRGGWQLPFLAVAGLGLVIAALAVFLLPPMRLHLQAQPDATPQRYFDLFTRPGVALAYVTTAVVMVSAFAIIPNISAYLQNNLHWPRADMGWLYLAGGSVSFFTTRLVGRLVDQFGAFRMATLGCIGVAIVLWTGFYQVPALLPVPALFVGLMMSMSFRNVPFNTLISMVPGPQQRAQFMSLQSSVQHLGASGGAFLSSVFLTERADHGLDGMASVVVVSLVLTALLPALFHALERVVKQPPQPVPVPAM